MAMWTKPQPPQIPSGITQALPVRTGRCHGRDDPEWQRLGEQVTAVQCPVEV